MHTIIGILNGQGLISPIIAILMAHPKTKNYKDKTIISNANESKHHRENQIESPIAPLLMRGHHGSGE